MKCISLLLTFLFMGCHSFVTLNLNEIKKNNVYDFFSDTTPSHSLTDLTDDKARLGAQKSWEYPEKSKQMRNPEGQKMDKIFSKFSLPLYEHGQWLNQLRLLLIEPLEEETRLKNFDKKSETVNETSWTSSALRDKNVLMKAGDIFGNLLDSLPMLNAIYGDNFLDELYIKPGTLTSPSKYKRDIHEDEMNSIGNEAEQLDRIRFFFEELCRKHHSMLSKLSIEHNHYPSSDSNEPKKILLFQK